MKYLIFSSLISVLLLNSCSTKKTGQTQGADSLRQSVLKKIALTDSIDHSLALYDKRLDIKMKRKTYQPAPETLVTLQKWFEYGDTTRLVKLRKEVLTLARMEVVQYHYLSGKLAEVHNYVYDKQCSNGQKQCVDEEKYFFVHDSLTMAQKRHAEAPASQIPAIESVSFSPFQPEKLVITGQQTELSQINQKYASLPYPKPRPEKGSPVIKGR